MTRLSERVCLRTSIGLSINDQEIVGSLVGWTPRGPLERRQAREFYRSDDLEAAVDRILRQLLGNKKPGGRTQVTVGLSSQRLLFTSRAIASNRGDYAPEALIEGVLLTPNVNLSELAVDASKLSSGKHDVAIMVSCRKRYLIDLLAILESLGIQPHRVEPAPTAALRVAQLVRKAPRKARLVVRVLLGSVRSLAVLAFDNQPIAYRFLDSCEEGVEGTILPAIRSLQLHGERCGLPETLDAVIVHGRPDLLTPRDFEVLAQRLDCPSIRSDTPDFDERTEALGLALGCHPQASGLDLSARFKPLPALWKIVPWGEAALQVSLLVCVSLFLDWRAASVRAEYRSLQSQVAKLPWIQKLDQAALDGQRKELTTQVEAASAFMGGRLVWTAYTQDLARRLPKEIRLTSLHGDYGFVMAGKGMNAPKRSLILRFVAPIPQGTAIPKEIDEFVKSLREHPLLKRDLPMVKLGDLKWQPATGQSVSVAEFTVFCLPKLEKGGPKQAAATPKEGH